MTTALFIVALVGAFACPAHMLWRMRRGHHASVQPAGDELRRPSVEIEARIRAAEQPRERERARP